MRENILKSINELFLVHNTFNPFTICKSLDIPIGKGDLGPFNGVFVNDSRWFKDGDMPKNGIILLHMSLDEFRTLFTCAHELGHAIFHPHENCFRNPYYINRRFEKEATCFAVMLLLKYADIDLSSYTDMTYGKLSIITGVPEEQLENWFG